MLTSALPEVAEARGVSTRRAELYFLIVMALATSMTVPGRRRAADVQPDDRPGRRGPLGHRPAGRRARPLGASSPWPPSGSRSPCPTETNWPLGFFVGVIGAAFYLSASAPGPWPATPCATRWGSTPHPFGVTKLKLWNRLKSATSPYLLQHADNPVDWWPWSDEAFAEARRRDVPVLLSVGYAACHWCHVMAHESFEDQATAEVVNDSVVAIKVDREERPDIDAVYMSATQAMTGQGGWPMTVFMTPDGEPFLCGTYFPRARFVQLVTAVVGAPGNRTRTGSRASRSGSRKTLADNASAMSALGGQAGELHLDDVTGHRGGRPGGELRPGARRLRRRAQVPAVDGP